ncbi:MAG: flagellar type III secretion system pore protein FliP [Firmicutes bacterium]|nr:flagellar type III secretion system pore protein FliP [Bacillota bacterium]
MSRWIAAGLATVPAVVWTGAAKAQVPFPRLEVGISAAEGPGDVALTLQIVALLTVLSLAPAILVMLTSFTRIVVVLSFVRSALALQQTPPNQVIIGLALFLTFFTMAPTWQAAFEDGLRPYLAGEITEEETLQRVSGPLRDFMLRNTREQDLGLFVELAGNGAPAAPDDVPTYVLIPAFIVSELRTAFQLGFVLFVPFLVIDMVVASALMSMGMLMLPPVMISLPFKVLLFVMVDGWHLITRSLLMSFQ